MRVAVISNQRSGRGRGRALTRRTLEAARAAGHQVTELASSSVAELASEVAALEPGPWRLVGIGGDGLLHHLAATAVRRDELSIGIVPRGSGNDGARALGIPTGEAAIEIALGPDRLVDLGRTDAGGCFVTVATFGFPAQVNAAAERVRLPLGQARYTLATLTELGRLSAPAYRLLVDAEPVELEACIVAVANTGWFGGGMHIAPGAAADDGRLTLVTVAPVSRGELIRFLPRIFSGRHLDHPAVTQRPVQRVELLDSGVEVWADGEPLTHSPTGLSVEPTRLRIAAP